MADEDKPLFADLMEKLAQEMKNPTPPKYDETGDFPHAVEVIGVAFNSQNKIIREKLIFGGKQGDYVSIRPVSDNPENKTFLGLLLGDVATSISATYITADKQLFLAPAGHNPAIWVPDLNKIVYGYESWWGTIDSVEQLRKISDDDINSVWYVQALKQLEARESAEV